jgi:hypothetical protein
VKVVFSGWRQSEWRRCSRQHSMGCIHTRGQPRLVTTLIAVLGRYVETWKVLCALCIDIVGARPLLSIPDLTMPCALILNLVHDRLKGYAGTGSRCFVQLVGPCLLEGLGQEAIHCWLKALCAHWIRTGALCGFHAYYGCLH